MNKKNTLLITAITLSMAIFAGCGNSSQEPQKTSSTTTTATESSTTISATTVTPTTAVPTTKTTPTTATPVESEAEKILDKMTLEEKVAQMFWVRCPEENAGLIQNTYQFGGYILFGRDFANETRDSVSANIAEYQRVSKIPALIGVDEEGGTVTRVSHYSQFRAVPFWAPRGLYADGGFDLVSSNELEKATLLSSLGINTNLAPVCDLSDDSADFIYKRSFGVSPELTSQFVQTIVSVSQENGVGTVLKHFPGYGNNVDTHTGIAIDERAYDTFVNNDFIPFKAGIVAGAGCILVSHNIVKCMDADKPSSLSSAVHDIIRNTLGFTGVIMTDDLSMDAITEYADGKDAAVAAVIAGNDLLCIDDYEHQYPAVLNAVKDGTITEARINESVIRILHWKMNLGIID